MDNSNLFANSAESNLFANNVEKELFATGNNQGGLFVTGESQSSLFKDEKKKSYSRVAYQENMKNYFGADDML